MSQNCNTVVFSNKAYNAIIRETFDKHPVETGGILLGHIIDGIWLVMEVLPPGINSIFQTAYFEYDEQFVNYLAQSVANQYKKPLSLLGLWHRHPGSMDVFSGTDDQTNSTFARQLTKGVISGLVNVDPKFRFTMYYLDRNKIGKVRPEYEKIDVEVGDDIIPPSFFELKYVSSVGENIHPMPTIDNAQSFTFRTKKEERKGYDDDDETANDSLLGCLGRHWKEVAIILLAGALLCSLSFLFCGEACVRKPKEEDKEKVKNNNEDVIPATSTQDAATIQTKKDDVEQEKTVEDGEQGNNDK